MPRLFNRVISFHIQGEIYDNETSPESIIKNYIWSAKDNNGKISMVATHKDKRGKITKMIPIPKISRWKKPDTEFFLI